MDSLKAFIKKNSKHAKTFFIYTRIANYYQDKLRLMEELMPLVMGKSNLIIGTKFDNLDPDRLLTIYLDTPEINQMNQKIIRDSRMTSHPFYNENILIRKYIGENKLKQICAGEYDQIKSLADLKVYISKEFKLPTVYYITIDTNISLEEIEITKDLLCILASMQISFKWCFIGKIPSIKITEAGLMFKAYRFLENQWDLTISKPCYITLLCDNDSLIEIDLSSSGMMQQNEDKSMQIYG